MDMQSSQQKTLFWLKLLLAVPAIICLAAVIWAGYQLYSQKIGQITCILLVFAAIAVLIWNISLVFRYRVGYAVTLTIFTVTILLAVATCAFTDIEPLASAKDSISNWFNNLILAP
jgi:hypothetical protein